MSPTKYTHFIKFPVGEDMAIDVFKFSGTPTRNFSRPEKNYFIDGLNLKKIEWKPDGDIKRENRH